MSVFTGEKFEMTELERRALMGEQEAQLECTEKGIVLPCPFCGGEPIIEYDTVNPFEYAVFCEDCGVMTTTAEEKKIAIKDWNTRPAPPIGRCRECKHLDNAGKSPACWHTGLRLRSTQDDFCSYFEPKECEE